MLPRPRRPHDQLLGVRTETIVGSVGGLIIGYIGWLVAVSIGMGTTTVATWSVVVAVLSAAIGVIAVLIGGRRYRRGDRGWATFALALPIGPVLLSLYVLAIVYLMD
jgi:hypothetical protein